MSKHIFNRDSFVNEVYSQMSEEQLNEGIFDFFKTIAGNEWKKLRSKNTEIKDKLEKADRELTGFTLMKLKKSGSCKSIRLALLDFANTLWEAKEKELEDSTKLNKMLMGLRDKDEVTDEEEEQLKKAGNVSKFMKQFYIKDKALAENLTSYEKKIKELCQGDPDLIRWSNMLKEDIRNIINRMIIDKCDADAAEKKKAEDEVKKQETEKKKSDEKKNKESEALQKKRIAEIEKERKTSLSNLGVSPVDGSKTGDKVFQEINTEFSKVLDGMKINVENLLKESELYEYSFENVLNESKLVDSVGNDSLIGIKNIPELVKNAKVKANLLGTRILKELGIVFNAITKLSDSGKSFAEIPGDSIQALYVGLSSVISHAMTDGELDDNAKNLLARCAISGDKTLGYGLPLVNPNKPKEGNIFVAITTTLQKPTNQNAFMIKKKGEKPKLNDELFNAFTKNINSMFDDIKKFAEELKKKKEKEDEVEAKKAEQEAEKE